MQIGPSPLFIWVSGRSINLALCQGFYGSYDEEDGWQVCYNMVDGSISNYHESEEDADAEVAAVYGVMQAHGYAIAGPEDSEE